MRMLEIGPGKTRLPGFETLNIVKTAATDHVGDARRPPFKDAQFDVVFSSHCIEHVHWYEVEATIKQWVRILKPGGRLEVWTVDAYKLMKALITLEETGEWQGPKIGTWQELLTLRDPYKWGVGHIMNYPKHGRDEHHCHRAILTPKYMLRVFCEAGLEDVRMMDQATELRGGKDHGWINMGILGVKPCSTSEA